MTDLVILVLGQSPLAPVTWGAFVKGRPRRAGRVRNVGELRSIASLVAEDTRVVAIVPGEQAAIRALPAPPRDQAKLRAAAQYLLEDELAQAVDQLQIVCHVEDGAGTAYAISKLLLNDWLEATDAAGIRVTEMVPDFACIGGGKDNCVIVAENERIIASRGDCGFAAETSLAKAMLPDLVKGESAAPICYGNYALTEDMLDVPIERRKMPEKVGALTLYASYLQSAAAPVNFLTGEYRRKLKGVFPLAPLRRSMMLSAGFAAAFCAVFVAAAVRDARVAARYEDVARQLHAQEFPAFAGGDIRMHADTVIAETAQAATFLDLNGRLSAALEQTPNLAVDRIRYDAVRKQFSFSIRSGSDSEIETLRRRLVEKGVNAIDSGGYRRSGEVWIGEMAAALQ